MSRAVAAAAAPTVDRDVPLRGSLLLRSLRGAGWTLIWVGALTLGFVVHQLWITTWLAGLNQGALDDQRREHFASATITEVVYEPATTAAPGSSGGTAGGEGTNGGAVIPGSDPSFLKVESPPDRGESFALIRIPKLESLREGWNVVEGVTRKELKTGAGHMPWTPLPGQPGNAVISGHRTTYGAPFHDIDRLEPGDRIEVDTALGTHVYEVRESMIVRPTDVWVTDPREGAWLTLTTCHPKFSARQRLVVFAELVAGPNAEVILAAS